MEEKERVCEQELRPLIEKLHEIAAQHGIPFMFSMQMGETQESYKMVHDCYLPRGCSADLRLAASIAEYGIEEVAIQSIANAWGALGIEQEGRATHD